MAVFTSEVVFPCQASQVFDFLTQPENLKKISPPEVGLRFLNAPEQYQLGSEVQFAIQTFGLVQKITHRITEFSAPARFVEELVSGPLPLWIHRHDFLEISADETRIIDEIEFEPPGGLVGMMLTENRIIDHLDDAIYFRQKQLTRFLLES
ncbi:MAG: SRPBCC family protein [Planctomycetaceae bacterium]|nr:SRPBCC family protein [Planctomycetaceae bacterium]